LVHGSGEPRALAGRRSAAAGKRRQIADLSVAAERQVAAHHLEQVVQPFGVRHLERGHISSFFSMIMEISSQQELVNGYFEVYRNEARSA
jgi:hypothetical protein